MQFGKTLYVTYKTARRIVVGVVGGTVLVIGIVLLVLPGPAFVVIPLGLAILGLEFAWARRWLRKAKQQIQRTVNTREEKEGNNG